MLFKLRVLGLLPALTCWAAAAQAAPFEGFTVEAALVKKFDRTSAGPWVNDPDVSTNGPQTSGQKSKTAVSLDLGYGLPLSSQIVLTTGLAYTTGADTVTSSYAKATDGLLNVPVKSRLDLYLAPGLRLSPTQLVYLKAGYAAFKYGTSTDETGAPQHGQPGRRGFLLGVGYKQLLDANSPAYFHLSYSVAKSAQGRIDDGTKFLDTRLTSGTFGLGLGYSF